MRKNSRIFLIAIYIGIALYLLPMYPHGGSANELTRWATAASLIEKGSFEISWTEPLIGPNVDTAKIGDRTYSNKAPGPAIIAAPFYALTRVFIGPPDASNIRISWFAMRVAISTLPLLLLAVWLYRRGTSELSLAVLLFATPLFLYSLLFFSHVFVAVLIYAAFTLLYDDGELPAWRNVAAGVACGLAVISEFPAVFAVAVFGAGLLFTEKQLRVSRVGYFLLGGLPFAAFLLIYNNALFGSPFSMSYAHESFPEWAEVASQGVFGIGFPSLSNAYLLLLSPSRGLLFTSPILVISVYLLVRGFDRTNLRKMVRLAAVVLSILVICGHGAAHGGWAFGARYLIFIIPLLLDPFFEGEADNVPSVWLGLLFGLSVVLSVIPALTFPFAPPEFAFPHNDLWMSLLRGKGWFVPTFANVLGASATFWTLVPVLAGLAAAIYLIYRNAARPTRFLAGLAVGLVAVSIYTVLPGIGGREEAFRRATIAERYFRPAERLEAFAADPAAARRVNDYRWTIADARAYAPNDFPYLETHTLTPSPTASVKTAIALVKQGKSADAERILTAGRDELPFARCEFSTNLAVIHFTAGQKDAALAELESVQTLVNPASRPDCLRSQYLLGSLYRDLGRETDAQQTFQKFLANTAGSTDAETKALRKSLNAK